MVYKFQCGLCHESYYKECRIFQIALRGEGIPPLWGMGNFAGGIFLSGDGDIKSDFDHSNENMKIII